MKRKLYILPWKYVKGYFIKIVLGNITSKSLKVTVIKDFFPGVTSYSKNPSRLLWTIAIIYLKIPWNLRHGLKHEMLAVNNNPTEF
jgi:hypothetical protein